MDPAAIQEAKNEAVAALAQAFANPVRLRMLAVLEQAEHSVDVLAAKVGQSRANTSAQIKVLAQAGLLESRREGRRVYYRLASDGARELLVALQRTAMTENPAMREIARAHYDLEPPLSRRRVRELRAEVRAGERLLVDLRPIEEYEAGHPKSAVSLPASELGERLPALPDKPLLAYCRGRWCPVAAQSVERLRGAGREAINLGASPRALIAAGL